MKNQRKKILMLLENNGYPGDPRVQREANALTAAGYMVSVIAPREEANEPWREEIEGVMAYRFPAPSEGEGFLGYLWEYGYSLIVMFILSLVVIFQRGFHIIHSHNPPDIMVLIALLYKPFGVKYVFDHHDLSPEMYHANFGDDGNNLVFEALVFFEKLTCKVADHLIATNQSYKNMQIERSGVSADKVTIVRNGPNPDRIRLVDPDPMLANMGKIIIGYVGEMSPHDGLDYLLRALHHLAYDLNRTDFYAVLIGDGTAWEGLHDLVKELELDEYVWLTGYVSTADMLAYLSASHICVDPDPYNEFNDRCTMVKMTEYMALGKPIVAFDLTEHRVTAQNAALYVKNNDELEFARKIVQLMDNPVAREQMGVWGKARVEQKLAWSFQAESLLNAYASLTDVAVSEKTKKNI